MPDNRRSGILSIQVNGEVYDAAGDFTYNPGFNKREALIGPSGVQGYKEEPQVAFIEGEIRDARNLDLKKLMTVKDATVTLDLANDKTFMLRDAWQANEGNIGTGEANIEVRFEGMSGEEILP